MPDMDANDYTIKLGGMTVWNKGKEIFDFPTMTFTDVDYIAFVAMQQLRLREMNTLGAVGPARIEAAGKGDELRAFIGSVGEMELGMRAVVVPSAAKGDPGAPTIPGVHGH